MVLQQFSTLFFVIFLIIGCEDAEKPEEPSPPNTVNRTFNGISFESPPQPFEAEEFEHISTVSANAMAISPYAFSYRDRPLVIFDSENQWWGETTEGTGVIIDYAQSYNLKLMVKPQVWLWGSWVGEYQMTNEEDWLEWQDQYRAYVLNFATLAESKGVELFCVGTEYKIAAVERVAFWKELISEIRTIFSGKLTYAANWDNYHNITFWDELDYIGIDLYPPLVDSKTPSVDEILPAWNIEFERLKTLSELHGKQILFTEYGYMSCDFTAWKNWENEGNIEALDVNLEGQANAFEAFYQTYWDEDWVAGGFIWKWEVPYLSSGGENNKRYTPQRKPSEAVIKKWYNRP